MIEGESGSEVYSSRMMVIFGYEAMRSVTRAENFSRSTAKAPPAGTREAYAQESIRESKSESSSLRMPDAETLESLFSEPRELLHTISASWPVLCAGVRSAGRIS